MHVSITQDFPMLPKYIACIFQHEDRNICNTMNNTLGAKTQALTLGLDIVFSMLIDGAFPLQLIPT